MNPARAAMPWVMGAFTSSRLRDARRWLAERRRRAAGEPHRIRYFHQVDDPYSHLAAQVLGQLVHHYDAVLDPFLVGPPPDDAAPERERLRAFGRRDAADVAPGYGLAFPAGVPAPDEADVSLAARILAGAAPEAFVALAPRVGEALWQRDRAGLEALASESPPASAEAARAATARGDVLRAKLGHYLGGTLHYGGEWYWGVDRLHHLERRLRALGAARPDAPEGLIAPRPEPERLPPLREGGPLVLDFFPSLRSPYTWIAFERVLALPRRYPIELVLRPVLPMVMRGLPVPRAKQLYIALDTRREGEDAGVPFGFFCDPVGRPVERAFSLYPWARERGRGSELLLEFMRASWSEGVDTGTDAGLRLVVERAGLRFEEARAHLDVDDFATELEANRKQLLALGLWGVPSFRLRGQAGEPDWCSWGQDRIWRLEQEIRRRLPGGA